MRRKRYDQSHRLEPGEEVYVYGFACEGYIKIGIAMNVKTRLSGVKVSCPFPVSVAFQRRVAHELADFVESGVHAELAEYHHFGEWFNCPVDLAKRVVHKWYGRARSKMLRDPPEPSPRAVEFEERKRRAEGVYEIYRERYGANCVLPFFRASDFAD